MIKGFVDLKECVLIFGIAVVEAMGGGVAKK